LFAASAGESTCVADKIPESSTTLFRLVETAFIPSMFRRLQRNSISFTLKKKAPE
jgi:hypothetical protein